MKKRFRKPLLAQTTPSRSFRRFRRHQFEAITTTKLRLEVLKATSAPEARLYEIRAYNE